MNRPDPCSDGERSSVGRGSAATGREHLIYSRRFTCGEDLTRQAVWRVLCRRFFQRYVRSSDTVLDLGAGDGLFISNIQAARRIAVDVSEHVKQLEGLGIEVFVCPAHEFTRFVSGRVDVIFMSNFLEHMPSKAMVLEVLEECRRGLKPGGTLMVLQPNIRYVRAAYWDYFDHQVPLTDQSLVEALKISGYKVKRMIPRFLPYTAKSRIGHLIRSEREWLIDLYLRFPVLWRVFGQQAFVVAEA